MFKKIKRLMLMVNIDEESPYILCTTRGNSVKFSEKMWLTDGIKSHEKQG